MATSPVTTVVNIHPTGEYDVYIGRSSPFGNPYHIGRDGTREQVIDRYRNYFQDRVRREPDFRALLENLRGKRLGCHCAPLACHGQLLVAYLTATG